MVNIIVLWQTVYIQSALDHLHAEGHESTPSTSPDSPRSDTQPSTSKAATAPPADHPPTTSAHSERPEHRLLLRILH